jgi:hypothetical protein
MMAWFGQRFRLNSSGLGLRLAQLSLVMIFLALVLAVSWYASEGPDEVAHFYFNRFVARYGRLPLNKEERLEAGYKADLPPLFHLLVGLTGQGADLDAPPYLKTSRNNPRLQLVLGHENLKAWRMLKTEDPLQGEILLFYWGRWFTLLSALASLALTYALLRLTWPGQPWLALGGVAVLALLPVYIYISGITSYEPLAGLFLTGYFLLLFWFIRQPEQSWLVFGLGLLLGLAALTRHTPWPLMPLPPALIAWLHHRRGSWLVLGRQLGLFSLGLLLTFGVWVFYIGFYFGQVTQLGWFHGLISPLFIGDGSGTTSQQMASVITGGAIGIHELSRQGDSFWQWGWHFFKDVWGAGWMAGLLLLIWGAALAGLVIRWRREEMLARLWLALLGLHVLLLLSLPFMRFLFSGQAATAMGQHIIFPAGVALILLLVEGLAVWLRPARLAGLLFLLAGLYLGYNLTSISDLFDERWPVQTVPASAAEQAVATFETISLIGYETEADGQSLKTTLHWRADELSVEDYWLELSLIDQQGRPQRRWLGQPLAGRYPTRAWSPSDRVEDIIDLPVAGLPAGSYRLQLRLGPEMSLAASAGGEAIALSEIDLRPSPFTPAASLAVNGQSIGYTVWPNSDLEGASYHENGTVLFLIRPPEQAEADEWQFKLVGPDDHSYSPLDQVGYLYNFSIKPGFSSGMYGLRVEQWREGQVIAQAETAPLLEVKTEARQFTLEQPISFPLSADFAGYVALLGYDLPQRRVQPGESFALTLYWQALRNIGADLIMFTRLVDANQKVWGGRDRLAREVYSTMLWAPQEIVTDPFTVQVDPNAPDGIYNVSVGLYLPVGESSVSVPLRREGQLSDVSHVTVGPIKIGKTPPGLTLATAQPQVPVDQPFGDPTALRLLGYDLAHSSESDFKLRIYWQVEAPLNVDYTTFVHLRDGSGELVAQQDQPPLKGAYPTSLWDRGEIIADDIILSIPPGLTAGQYEVVVGMYNPGTGQRLAIPGSRQQELSLRKVDLP